jgi:hypothetical protein
VQHHFDFLQGYHDAEVTPIVYERMQAFHALIVPAKPMSGAGDILPRATNDYYGAVRST